MSHILHPLLLLPPLPLYLLPLRFQAIFLPSKHLPHHYISYITIILPPQTPSHPILLSYPAPYPPHLISLFEGIFGCLPSLITIPPALYIIYHHHITSPDPWLSYFNTPPNPCSLPTIFAFLGSFLALFTQIFFL